MVSRCTTIEAGCDGGLMSPNDASTAQQPKGTVPSWDLGFPKPGQLVQVTWLEKKPHPAPCLPAIHGLARLDIKSRLVLVNYWICCHYNPDNCTTDLYLLLYCYLEINCLSLNLLGWCLLLYPEPISRQGCYEPLHCSNSGMLLFPASSSPGTEGFCSSQPRENPT